VIRLPVDYGSIPLDRLRRTLATNLLMGSGWITTTVRREQQSWDQSELHRSYGYGAGADRKTMRLRPNPGTYLGNKKAADSRYWVLMLHSPNGGPCEFTNAAVVLRVWLALVTVAADQLTLPQLARLQAPKPLLQTRQSELTAAKVGGTRSRSRFDPPGNGRGWKYVSFRMTKKTYTDYGRCASARYSATHGHGRSSSGERARSSSTLGGETVIDGVKVTLVDKDLAGSRPTVNMYALVYKKAEASTESWIWRFSASAGPNPAARRAPNYDRFKNMPGGDLRIGGAPPRQITFHRRRQRKSADLDELR